MSVKVDGIPMSRAAAEYVECTRIRPSEDLRRLVEREVTQEALLIECIDGCEDDRAIACWREYVMAIVAAAYIQHGWEE